MPKRDEEYMADRREEILAATARCMARLGISATTTTEICRDADISMGKLYKHFKSKEEIFVALADRSAANIVRDLSFTTVAEAYSFLIARLRHIYDDSHADVRRIEIQLVAESISTTSIKSFGKHNYDLSREMLLKGFVGLKKNCDLPADFDPEIATTLVENFNFGLFLRKIVGSAESQVQAEAALTRLLHQLFKVG